MAKLRKKGETPYVVRCPACGEEVEGSTPYPDMPWACDPCRAEHSGAVVLRLPAKATPHAAASTAGSARFMGDGRPVQLALGAWAFNLRKAADGVAEVAAALRAAPDGERVAEALMGCDPPELRLDAGASTGAMSLRLSGLPAAAARRLVETTMAEGPHMPDAEVEALLREAGPPPADRGVGEIPFRKRVAAALRRLGVRTVGDLAGCTAGRLLAQPNFGPSSIREVRLRLGELGLSLRGEGRT